MCIFYYSQCPKTTSCRNPYGSLLPSDLKSPELCHLERTTPGACRTHGSTVERQSSPCKICRRESATASLAARPSFITPDPPPSIGRRAASPAPEGGWTRYDIPADLCRVIGLESAVNEQRNQWRTRAGLLECHYPNCPRTFDKESDMVQHIKEERWSAHDLPFMCHNYACVDRFLLGWEAHDHILHDCPHYCSIELNIEGVPCRYGVAAPVPRDVWVHLSTGKGKTEAKPSRLNPREPLQWPDLWLLWQRVPPIKETLKSGSVTDRRRYIKEQWRDFLMPIPYETRSEYVSRQKHRVGMRWRSEAQLVANFNSFANNIGNVNLLRPDEAMSRHGRDSVKRQSKRFAESDARIL